MASVRTAPATGAEPLSPFARDLVEYIRSGYQALYIHTSEEVRIEHEIRTASIELKNTVVFTWDHFDGFRGLGVIDPQTKKSNAPQVPKEYAKILDPAAALRTLVTNPVDPDDKNTQCKWPPNAIFVFRDLDDFFVAPPVRRAMRSLCETNQLVNQTIRHPLLVTSPSAAIHPKLRNCFTALEFSLPSETQMLKAFKWVQESLRTTDPAKAECGPTLQDLIITNLLGLTFHEATDTLSKCIIRHSGFKQEMLMTIKHEKQGIMKKGEILTYIPEESMVRREDIGGYDKYLSFISRRALAYHPVAKACQIDNPKGVVLAGIPGCGKSMVAMATGLQLGLPVFIMNIGAVFGSLVGESEQRMRDALNQITAQQGCVLLIDEADKAWSGAGSGGRQDNGVSERIFGQLLSWLAAKQDRTFVIMTMNRVDGMPPELLRKGRFDEVYFVDLPNEDERQQIFNIHCRRRGLDPAKIGNAADWKTLITATHEFSGSEIEEIVKEARFYALERYFARFPTPDDAVASPEAGNATYEDMLKAVNNTKPASVLNKEQIDSMRNYCKERATNVSTPKLTAVSPPLRSLQTNN